MSTADDLQHITGSLEQLADRDVDITPQVYARFFARCPDAAALFDSTEARSVQGKMLAELVQTVIDRLEHKPYSATLVATMVDDHDSWGVTLPMYDAFLAAFMDVLTETLGEQGDPAALAVWQRELGTLRGQIAGKLAAG